MHYKSNVYNYSVGIGNPSSRNSKPPIEVYSNVLVLFQVLCLDCGSTIEARTPKLMRSEMLAHPSPLHDLPH